jgi:3-dehydroquinate synthase
MMTMMAQDKKVKRGRMTFILMRALGEAVIAPDVDPVKVSEFLDRKLAQR